MSNLDAGWEAYAKDFYQRWGCYPIAGGTNITWGFVTSGPGFINAYAKISTGTPTEEGIDMQSGGYGGQLQHFQYMSEHPTLEFPLTIDDEQAIPSIFYGLGNMGARRLGNGTQVLQLVAPLTWLEPFDNLVEFAGATFTQVLTGVSLGVAVISKIPTFSVILTSTAVATAILTRIVTYARTLVATALGVASLSRVTTFFKTLVATALIVTTMTTSLISGSNVIRLAYKKFRTLLH